MEVYAYRAQNLDLDLDLDMDPDQGEASETLAPALSLEVDAYLDMPEPDPQEPDSSIQLELAQEFAALGLLDGARELAQEVLGSAYAPLQMEAQALLSELDAQETSLRADQQATPPEET